MPGVEPSLYSFAVSIGIGLIIGLERERRKGSGPTRDVAGIRTFAVTALLGAVSVTIGGQIVLALCALCVGGLVVSANCQRQNEDPGLTTEIALLLTLLLGAFSMSNPQYAAGLAVILVVLLASRGKLHHFVKKVLTERELRDALILAASALVVLPLMPDRYIGPFDAINLRTIWLIVILMMSMSAAGYIAVRTIGPKYGLPIAGLASGFVSSVGTIASMASLAKRHPKLIRPAISGATFSSVATMVQMGIILSTISPPTFQRMIIPLLFGSLTASIYGLVFALKNDSKTTPESTPAGRAFSVPTTLLFAFLMSAVLIISVALRSWYGEAGFMAATITAGFIDSHAASASTATLVTANKITIGTATFAIVGILMSNTITKLGAACLLGFSSFAVRVILGLLLILASVWIGIRL